MSKKRKRQPRFKNDEFLKTLGSHCQKLRTTRGYSIDRMSKESEGLSPSVIHRLETGQGAVTVSAILRYADVLEVPVKDLFEFDFAQAENRTRALKLISNDSARVAKEAFKTLLPAYSIQAAAGYFGGGREVRPGGWVEVLRKSYDENYFVVQVSGHSMEPLLKDGDYVILRANPEGTRQGKIVLAQYRGPADPDTGGSYTIKKYSSVKVATRDESWRHQQIMLSPLNPDYEPILINPERADDFKIVAEFVEVLNA